MKIKSVRELRPSGKTALIRVDFNVPMDAEKIADDFKIRSGGLRTIEYLANRAARVIVVSHFGRPDGWDEKFTLEPIAERLGDLLNRKTIVLESGRKLPDYEIPHLYFIKQNIVNADISGVIREMREGDVAMLENIRFYEGEKENSRELAEILAKMADVFVNDGFAASHRVHASVVGVAEILPSFAGLELTRELEAMEKVMNHPKKPFLIMVGGMKLETKVGALLHLAKSADWILVGGGMANILLAAAGFNVGKSVYDKAELPTAKRLLRDYKNKLMLPRDVVISDGADGVAQLSDIDKVKSHQMILDIGPETIGAYSKRLREAKTILWNGPMGLFEKKRFSNGTYALARFLASRTKSRAYGVAGGGETMQVISNDKLGEYIDHVSTGGGAMLEYLAGKKLPGIEVLKK